MLLLPDEAKDLPPPGILNPNSLWLSFLGWCTAAAHNGINYKPMVKSGVHRQVLLASIGWFIGYHVSKIENFHHAQHDRDMSEYARLHPELFPVKEKKTFAEIVEPFHPIR